jgi:hypothetical protein
LDGVGDGEDDKHVKALFLPSPFSAPRLRVRKKLPMTVVRLTRVITHHRFILHNPERYSPTL